MKYPIDTTTVEKFFGHLVAHTRAQSQINDAAFILLRAAMEEMGMEDTDWYPEAKQLMKFREKLKIDHENRLFNEKNGLADKINQPLPSFGVDGTITDPELNKKLDDVESGFGGEMSEEDLAAHFKEKPKKKSKDGIDLSEKTPFKNMSIDEIEAWERKQENSNDIYKIKARVQNLAVGISGGNLTPVGTMMVNSFVHVVKDLYEFAETVQDKSLRIELIERIKRHETMPGTLIAAASSGVK